MCRADDDAVTVATTCGRPFADFELRIDATESGESGEVLLRGPNVMLGYLDDAAATAAAIDAAGWLHTGDLGVADEDGRIAFIDRLKDMLRVGGENVAPADVETALQAHPAVKLAKVVGVPDPRLVEVVAAYVQKKEGAAATAEELIAWCKERIAGFKVPRYVRFVDNFDAIGMTASSKIQRNKLREYALADLGLSSNVKRGPK
jgi:acyl-CoA synthetase (AMP-forming)/AMP-acid ligase II